MSTIPPYNRGMKCDFAEERVRIFHEEKKRARNEELAARLSMKKSFEDMLSELAALHGLNVRERAEERVREALFA